jgi:hypothetical protein
MPIYVSLAISWSALYGPDELEQVRQAFERDQAHYMEEWGATSPRYDDWQELIAGRIDHPPWFYVPYDESQDFTSALSYLCDDAAGRAERLEFIPHYLETPLEPAEQGSSIGHWRIYSAEIMALRWLSNYEDHARFERLALLYRWDRGWLNHVDGSDELEQLRSWYGEDIPLGDRLDARRRAQAYYVQRLGDLADVGRRTRVPGFVNW